MTPQQMIDALKALVTQLAPPEYKIPRTMCVDALNLLDMLERENSKDRDALAYERHKRWCLILISTYRNDFESSAEALFLIEETV